MADKVAKVALRENPLVPFALMKRMYAGMVESRLLEAHLAKRRGEGKRSPREGQEACRAAVLLSLEAGDFVVDQAGRAGSAWLRGDGLDEIVAGRARTLLPGFDDASQYVAGAISAAAVVKRMKSTHVVVVFVDAPVKQRVLRQALTVAATGELSVIFVTFVEAGGKSIARAATKVGVPGIPVEAQDAVALCRVAQESVLRARAGGGPALIECVRLHGGKRVPDPIPAMARTLLRVGACDEAWLDEVAPAFKARLKAIRHDRSG